MKNDLLIKGVGDNEYKNGYDYYHVMMGQGFVDTLEATAQFKEAIENDSRKENGVRMLVSTKIAKRNLTLRFNIHGDTREAFMTNKKTFEGMLLKGLVSIKINDTYHPDYYHLVYTGKSVTYKHSYNGRFGVLTAQFIEPNPGNRTGTPNAKVRVI